MPYSMTWEPKGVLKRFAGTVSWPEYARSQEEVLGDPRVDDIRYIINDLLDVESYSITPDEAEYSAAITRGASMSNPRVRITYVTRDARIMLLVMTVRALTPYQLKTFPTLDDARAWCEEKVAAGAS